MISRFLPKPDEERVNPHYRSGPPMQLYKIKKVEKIESTPEYRDLQAQRAKRREGAARAVATKRKRIDDYVSQLEIDVPILDKGELILRACSSYNAIKAGSDADWASPNSDPAFLARICVNYLRHELTSYEDNLQNIAGKVGAPDAYLEIKTKVLDAIAETYGWLSEECHKQEKRMYDNLLEVDLMLWVR